MKTPLCEQTLDNVVKGISDASWLQILHRDRGVQYTSELYRKAIKKCGIRKSMNNADAMTTPDAKVCGQDSKKNYCMDVMTPSK